MSIEKGDTIQVYKGCRALDILVGVLGTVTEVIPMGSDYSHSVKVVLVIAGKPRVLFARHINRLSDPIVNLNNGNPYNKVQIRLIKKLTTDRAE
jgi:hypothetical protein